MMLFQTQLTFFHIENMSSNNRSNLAEIYSEKGLKVWQINFNYAKPLSFIVVLLSVPVLVHALSKTIVLQIVPVIPFLTN